MLLLYLRWKDVFSITEVSTHVFGQYRFTFDIQRSSHIIWELYTFDIILTLPDYLYYWCTVSPLICFHIVEWHRPDWVLHQFGMSRHILESCDTSIKLHSINLQGWHDFDWRVEHQEYKEIWSHRCDHVVSSELIFRDISYYNPYMQWYCSITHQFITK